MDIGIGIARIRCGGGRGFMLLLVDVREWSAMVRMRSFHSWRRGRISTIFSSFVFFNAGATVVVVHGRSFVTVNGRTCNETTTAVIQSISCLGDDGFKYFFSNSPTVFFYDNLKI
jgi:hypothetical protein